MLLQIRTPNRAHLASDTPEIASTFRAADYQGCKVFEGEGAYALASVAPACWQGYWRGLLREAYYQTRRNFVSL